MKDITREVAESGRPSHSPLHCVKYCLEHLYADKQKRVLEEVAHNLTYEELIGALLHARDSIEALEELKREEERD